MRAHLVFGPQPPAPPPHVEGVTLNLTVEEFRILRKALGIVDLVKMREAGCDDSYPLYVAMAKVEV